MRRPGLKLHLGFGYVFTERGWIGTVARWRSLGVAAEQNTEMHIFAFGGGSEGFRSIRSAAGSLLFAAFLTTRSRRHPSRSPFPEGPTGQKAGPY